MKYLKNLLLVSLAFFVAISAGCQENEKLKLVNKYQYFEATIDDVPSINKIEAIIFLNYYHPEIGQIMMLIGNQKTVEKIVGHEINPQKVIDNRMWIEKLTANFKSARRVKRGCLDDARAVFITKQRAYMISIAKDDEVVYGPDYESKELKKDFDELGLK